ncbi:hypothetical protein N185_32260 [Sinorhizobium sp. GW3]|nr:hypothetical protein N185_32260 [Sinorhizobium sp. GW3]
MDPIAPQMLPTDDQTRVELCVTLAEAIVCAKNTDRRPEHFQSIHYATNLEQTMIKAAFEA